MRRPHAVGHPRTGRPLQHHWIERHTEPATDLDLIAARIAKEIVRVDDELAVLEQLDLLRDADVVEGDLGAHLRVAGQHRRGSRNSRQLRKSPQPSPIDVREQMVRHVLLVADRTVERRGETRSDRSRDMQSRNIMVRQNRCFFIDFQGGRTGPLQYDLASLLMDPYVALSPKTITVLYGYYVKRLSAHVGCNEPVFRKGFETCAITRNLQILGAFGHLSRNKGKTYFEAYIPRALQTLLKNIEAYHARDRLPGLRNIVQKAERELALSCKR